MRTISPVLLYGFLSRAKINSYGHNLSFYQMDGHYQLLKDNCCDAIRENRVLQHVINPELIINEMFRVLKPGGRCVLFELDWETFLSDGEDFNKIRNILNFWSDKFACGHIGRKLRRLFISAGFSNLLVIPKTYIFTSLAEAEIIFTLSENAWLAAESGVISQKEAKEYFRILIIWILKMNFFFFYRISCIRKITLKIYINPIFKNKLILSGIDIFSHNELLFFP